MKKLFFLFFLGICYNFIYSQIDTIKVKQLDEVILNSSRIDIPFSESSRSIQIISSSEIKKSSAKNLVSLLQQISGIDIRQRGVDGMQADLYIRGGSFDQTLLLIDGVKLDDSQTGHHNLNLLIPIELVERIEVVKGPAARIYGQNAFTGAINIVTKEISNSNSLLELQKGSFNQKKIKTTLVKKNILGHYSYTDSKGYRYNTDFINRNYFIKAKLFPNKTAINFLGYFSERNFGANGFYATPSAIDQYEETQASLISFSSNIIRNKIILKPKIYWRRNQDMYLYIRDKPSVYRNLHIGNKAGASLDMSLFSNFGSTGLGIDISKVSLSSNNLGNHQRHIVSVFFEHLILLFESKLDIIMGTSLNNYSDFGTHFFPGIDLGYKFSNELKLYLNTGNTYRIPTYTDLYYSDRTTLGNINLKPESASNFEMGLIYTKEYLKLSGSVFKRKSKNLIDYVKENQNDLWIANNILRLDTSGFEFEFNIRFDFNDFPHTYTLGYTFIEDKHSSTSFKFSKYSINSFKHNLISTLNSKWTSAISSNITFKTSERNSYKRYKVLDVGIKWEKSKWGISFNANNILNEIYSETNLVPMPKSNGSVSVNYKL